jgi:hypothetical protein
MNCDEFQKHILNYLTDRDFDHELKEKMEEHYFECDNCFNNLEIASATIAVIHSEGVDNLLRYSEDEEIQEKFKKTEDSYPIPPDVDTILKEVVILTSANPFPGNMIPFQDVLMAERFPGPDGSGIYIVGERISIDLEPPKDGYLTILLYDDENNLKLLFPEKGTDDICVKGGEKKQFGMVAAEPLCKQYLKAFWTSDQLMIPDQIDFGDESSIRSAIERFLKSISKLGDDDWTVFVQQFDVVEE